MRSIITFFTLLIAIALNAQDFQYQPFPVIKNGVEMINPWAGGMNCPQWASIDLNNDGKNDLFALDRTGNAQISFLNMDDTPGSMEYQYSREWLSEFPYIQHYAMVRDYNKDGVPDIFCSSLDEFTKGIKIFTGKWENGKLTFDRLLFPDHDDDILHFTNSDGEQKVLTIYLTNDYFAIDDIDGDEDLDMLTSNKTGDKLDYYKNMAVENGYAADTFLYEYVDECWGRFALLPNAGSLSLSLDPSMCAFFKEEDELEEKTAVHGGTTLLTYDSDNDGDKDILYGDLISRHIIFGKNTGTIDNAWITEQDTTFPSYDVSIDLPNFPATFMLDVDNDGLQDLMASPNQVWFTPDQQTAWLHKNVGSKQYPQFSYVQNDFLGETMLDFGTGARPVFTDVNADGLMDLVVGNRFYWTDDTLVTTLTLMLNIGTKSAPEFEVTDEDWLSFSQYSIDIETVSPTFGDLDGDGDLDLLVGDNEGFLHLLENTAGADMPMEFGPLQGYWQGIDVGRIATPFIYDINQDGLPDLLVGELQGAVFYFQNIGTLSNPLFISDAFAQPNNYFFGNISTQAVGTIAGYSQPYVLESNDSLILVAGTWEGWLKSYLINPDSISSGAFELLDERWGGTREGSATYVAYADLNDDQYLDAIIGNDRGGLTPFKTPILIDGMVNNNEISQLEKPYSIFPNPTGGILHIHSDERLEVSCYDLLGRIVLSEKFTTPKASIDLAGFPKGTYLMKIKWGDRIGVEKVVVQ